MSKFQWLKEYREKENIILLLEFKLETTQKELKRWSLGGDLSGIKLTPESDAAKLEDIIEQLEYELAHKMNDLFDLKKLVSTFHGIEHQVIKGKYIEGKTLEQIAYDIGYSESYIKKRHSEIVRTLHFIDAYSSI